MKDFEATADVIETHFDVVVIVEVMQRGGGHPGYDSLLADLGQSWIGLVTDEPRPNTSAGFAEFYAIFFRRDIVSECNGWSGLRFAADPNDLFSREPAYGCLVATIGNNRFDFLLAAYHARWADGDSDEIADEVEELHNVIDEMENAQPGEEDLLIMGDFNLVPDDLQFIGFETNVQGSGSTLNSQGNRTSNLYDHLILPSSVSVAELTGPLQVLDVRKAAASNRDFYRSISDHLPIVGLFTLGTDDD